MKSLIKLGAALLFYQTQCVCLDLNKYRHNYYTKVFFITVITIP